MTLSPFEHYAKAFCFMIAAAPKPSKLIEAMPVELPIAEMTLAEKLRAMEALWTDLSRNEQDIQSPVWHGQVLEERNARVKSGQEKFMDWEAAKQELRDRLK